MKNKDGNLKKAAFIVMSSMVVSRLTGFLRSALIPNLIARSDSDALFAAFKTTDIMYNLLVGGAIAAALIPVLSGYIAKGEEEEGWKVTGSFINTIILLMTVISVLGIIFAKQIIRVTAPGYDPATTLLTVKLTRILFPSVSFIMLAGLINGILNSYQRFAAAAYGPSIYNLGSVLSILAFHDKSIGWVAGGIMISALTYFLFQLSFAIKNMDHYRPKIYFRHRGYHRIIYLAIPSLLASSVVQLNTVISQSYTSNYSPGSVTALSNANDIWQLPYGIFAMGLGTALLPSLSEKIALNDTDSFKGIFSRGIFSILLLTIPSAVGFIVLRQPVISAIFKWSPSFTRERIMETGQILMFYSPALFSQSILAIVNRAFYALNDTKTPLFTGILSIGVNAGFCYIFFNHTSLGASGMALAYSLAGTVNALVLLKLLGRKTGGMGLLNYTGKFLGILFSSLAMGILVAVIIKFVPVDFINPFNARGKVRELFYLFLVIGAGGVFYFIMAFITGVVKAGDLKSMLKRG